MSRNRGYDTWSPEQERINRINKLLDRLDRIPLLLDELHEKLFNPKGYDRNEYACLVDERNNLLHEQERVERELREVYHMRID